MIFNYTDMNQRDAFCDIERFGNLVIATELKENTGASVTNAADYIATQYCTSHGISFEDLIFVERYDHRSYEGKKSPDCSLVTFQIRERFGQPHFTTSDWKYLTPAAFEELVRNHQQPMTERIAAARAEADRRNIDHMTTRITQEREV